MPKATRRRALLGLDEPGFTVNFNALEYPTEDERLILKTNSGSYYMWNFTTVEGLACYMPPQHSYIALNKPCYGNEALEIDGFFPYGNGPIVSCGDELGKQYAPMLFRYDAAAGKSYAQFFDAAGQFSEVLTSSQPLKNAPVRKRMRVERRGTQVTYYTNTDPNLPDLTPIASVNCVGAYGSSDLVNAMTGLKYRTGFAFVSDLVYLNYIKWEKL